MGNKIKYIVDYLYNSEKVVYIAQKVPAFQMKDFFDFGWYLSSSGRLWFKLKSILVAFIVLGVIQPICNLGRRAGINEEKWFIWLLVVCTIFVTIFLVFGAEIFRSIKNEQVILVEDGIVLYRNSILRKYKFEEIERIDAVSGQKLQIILENGNLIEFDGIKGYEFEREFMKIRPDEQITQKSYFEYGELNSAFKKEPIKISHFEYDELKSEFAKEPMKIHPDEQICFEHEPHFEYELESEFAKEPVKIHPDEQICFEHESEESSSGNLWSWVWWVILFFIWVLLKSLKYYCPPG